MSYSWSKIICCQSELCRFAIQTVRHLKEVAGPAEGEGQGGLSPPPPHYFENYKELLRKSVSPPLWVTSSSAVPESFRFPASTPPTLVTELYILYMLFTVCFWDMSSIFMKFKCFSLYGRVTRASKRSPNTTGKYIITKSNQWSLTVFFVVHFFVEHEAEKCLQVFREHSKNILRLRKGEELLFWILHKIMKIICFSADVHRCNTTFTI